MRLLRGSLIVTAAVRPVGYLNIQESEPHSSKKTLLPGVLPVNNASREDGSVDRCVWIGELVGETETKIGRVTQAAEVAAEAPESDISGNATQPGGTALGHRSGPGLLGFGWLDRRGCRELAVDPSPANPLLDPSRREPSCGGALRHGGCKAAVVLEALLHQVTEHRRDRVAVEASQAKTLADLGRRPLPDRQQPQGGRSCSLAPLGRPQLRRRLAGGSCPLAQRRGRGYSSPAEGSCGTRPRVSRIRFSMSRATSGFSVRN
jgi:hypothetical protein